VNKRQSTVYVIDDDASVRNSLARLIKSVGYEAKTYDSAQAFLEQYAPSDLECLITDIRMPHVSGLELQEQLSEKKADLPIVFITGHGNVPVCARAMKGGAVDFIMKPFDNQTMLEAINQALSKDLARKKEQKAKQEAEKRIADLSPREREVMSLVVRGLTSEEVADQLKISKKTVHVHRAKVMEKSGVDSLAELVLLAHEAGIV
jgi:FixJ family two-component response regulator